MRKIKECICDSTEKVSMETGNPVFPICLGYFLKNMAAVLLLDADQRLMQDVPTVTTGKDKYDGKAKDLATIFDIITVLRGDDLVRSMGQQMQLQGFLGWLMEEDEPDYFEDGDLTMWFDMDFLVEKWNEYIKRPHSRDNV